MTLTEKRDDILRGYSKENFKYIRNALRNIYKILGQDEKLKEIDKFTAAQLLKDTRLKNDVSDEDDYEEYENVINNIKNNEKKINDNNKRIREINDMLAKLKDFLSKRKTDELQTVKQQLINALNKIKGDDNLKRQIKLKINEIEKQ